MKCNENDCGILYDAFSFINSISSLARHKLREHNINNTTCENCNAYFEFEAIDSVKFTCEEQLELHKHKGKCFNFKTPVNYVWFGLPVSEFISTSIDNTMVVYTGESEKSIFRSFDQLLVLYSNHKKAMMISLRR